MLHIWSWCGMKWARPSVIAEGLVQKVGKKVKNRRNFMISSLSNEFLQISRSVLYETVTRCLNYHFALWHACAHTANQTQDLIGSFGWEQLDHPPYSPDLAPSDYHLSLQRDFIWIFKMASVKVRLNGCNP